MLALVPPRKLANLASAAYEISFCIAAIGTTWATGETCAIDNGVLRE
jgi:hypothetical protein